MKSNFEFVKVLPNFEQLFVFCHDAEMLLNNKPDLSAISARKALESVVRNFYVAKYGYVDPDSSLFELVQDYRFTDFTEEALLKPIHFIRIVGNRGAHGDKVTKREAFKCVESLHAVVGEFLSLLGAIEDYPVFDGNIYTAEETAEEYHGDQEIVVQDNVKNLGKNIAENAKAKNPIQLSEAETRKLYIDIAIKEAGWDICYTKHAEIASTACIETQVEGMPFGSGTGFVDYTLFGDDGVPLAIIEAKKTSVDSSVGRKQAKLYADCMEEKYRVRPVIFYTNGYEYNIIDGVYNGVEDASRRVYGIYSKSELQAIIKRDSTVIRNMSVDRDISDRYFIQNAATAVCESFNNNRRKALVVMATGTGKTRCAISIVDILQKANFVKKVLFLADRTALVDQAKNSFVKYLPDSSVCVLNDNSRPADPNAKITLSTYQTLINKIDCENKEYGIAAFDLIIVDECHRSIYNKYKAIFNYFDSRILGLTATPREEVEKSTYEAFDLPDGEPTYTYDLDKAIEEGFLVDYHAFERTTQLLKNGLKYENLSESEKEQYEKLFGLNGEVPDEINNELFYGQIINKKTIDIVINCILNEGLKINSGERLGKTIIFAANHKHAEAIVNRFNQIHPELGENYCQLIDNTVNYAQKIINDFKVPEKEPVIAVSVDMLDTGIDVPEILNLVFFKRVYSKIKFWQMIGRGTRVCEDLNVLSPRKSFFNGTSGDPAGSDEIEKCRDKQGFYIFDFCDVFEFFGNHPDGKKASTTKNLSQKIFDCKAQMVKELQKLEHQENEDHKKYYLKYRSELNGIVKGLNRNLINVRTNLKAVDKYSLEETWENLSDYNIKELELQISPLVDPNSLNEESAAFDLWMFNIELTEIIGEKDYTKAINSVVMICNLLLNKTTVPAVNIQKDKLKEFTTSIFWTNITLDKLEQVRTVVRDLLQFLDKSSLLELLTNFSDKLIEKAGGQVPAAPDFRNYKQKVIDYLIENSDDPIIEKIKTLRPISTYELKKIEKILEDLGPEEEFKKYAPGMSPAAFIRQLVGLDNKTINEMLFKWENEYQFNSKQQDFIREIVDFVRQNGDIVPMDLVRSDPFTNTYNPSDFEDKLTPFLNIVKMFHDVITPEVA